MTGQRARGILSALMLCSINGSLVGSTWKKDNGGQEKCVHNPHQLTATKEIMRGGEGRGCEHPLQKWGSPLAYNGQEPGVKCLSRAGQLCTTRCSVHQGMSLPWRHTACHPGGVLTAVGLWSRSYVSYSVHLSFNRHLSSTHEGPRQNRAGSPRCQECPQERRRREKDTN